MEGNEMRGMVLSFAGDVAVRCVERIRAAGLESGTLQEEIDAGGTKWNVNVYYCVDHDLVVIKGDPERETPEGPFPPQIMAMFTGQDGEPGFQYHLPSTWLPTLATVEHPMGGAEGGEGNLPA